MKKQIVMAMALMAAAVFAADTAEKPKPGRTSEVRVEKSNNKTSEKGLGFDWTTDQNQQDFFKSAANVQNNMNRIFARQGAGPGDHPLVISVGGLDNAGVENMEEDLTIMSRILNKAVQGDKDESSRKAMGIHLWALGEGHGSRNIYIEGHGAVFVLDVAMPVVGSRAKDDDGEKSKEEGSSTWESAKREVFGDQGGGRGTIRRGKLAPTAFDEERVSELKKSLAEALKNASNIRGLKDNESVTVVVQGSGANTSRIVTKEGEVRVESFAYAGPGAGSGPKTVMTLRAKKSDIDAFAKGRLGEDDFRKKLGATTYRSGGKKEN